MPGSAGCFRYTGVGVGRMELLRRGRSVVTRVVALVPAFNEADSLGATLAALLVQTHPVEVVVLPNGCTDATAEVARQYPVTVREFGRSWSTRNLRR